MITISKPEATEYNPFYANYINKVETTDVLGFLKTQGEAFCDVLYALPAEKGDYAYAPGKWTVKELLGHINDAERVFAYRALSIARGEQQPLPGFEQDDYVQAANFNQRTLASLIDEFRYCRLATLHLFNNFTEHELTRAGTASGSPVTVRAIIYIVAGHLNHHRQVLKANYGIGK